MLESNHNDCADTLLDLLCYELTCGRVTPEMRALLIAHLEECPVCSRRVHQFMGLIAEDGCIGMPMRVN